ncbi:rhodanese-like domain-containing protein [Thalassospiraceae bacterium SW-3-3]|nr:rhodanese-like domain-containing protein [Thalassospiraceae bacterium SW-3-3]
MVVKITRDELKTALAGPDAPTLIEALPAKYYLDAHLPGAINIPHDLIAEIATQVLPDKTSPIVVYCASGPCRNSGLAAETLTGLGYSNVCDYHEGKQDWQAAGLPVQGQSILQTA